MRHVWFQVMILTLTTGASWLSADTATSSGPAMKHPVETVLAFNFFQENARSREESGARHPVMVPAGTPFRVRVGEMIDVDSTKAGAQFRGTVDDPIMLGGDVIVPRGADVVLVAAKVDQGGRFKGSDLIELKVNSISVRGRAYQVVTSVAQSKTAGEGKKSTRKVAGGAGLGYHRRDRRRGIGRGNRRPGRWRGRYGNGRQRPTSSEDSRGNTSGVSTDV